MGPMFGSAVAVRRMLAQGGGAIVNVSSIQGVAAFPRYYVYDAAKAGVLMATKSIAVDYGPLRHPRKRRASRAASRRR